MNKILSLFILGFFLVGTFHFSYKTNTKDLSSTPEKETVLEKPSPSLEEQQTQQLLQSILTESPQAQKLNQLDTVIHFSARYLEENCDQEGKFNYRVNTNPQVSVQPKYNILRHAGTIYALAQYTQVFHKKETEKTLKRAIEFLKKKAMAPVPEHPEMMAIWSSPEINHSGEPLQAKLGGTGLGLVALLSVEKIIPKTSTLPELQALGKFILFLQREDGSFISKYFPRSPTKESTWVSLYYPGEAALGLLFLYEFDPDPKWLEGAIKALTYLAEQRKNKKEVEPDHWALIATEKLFMLKTLQPEIIVPTEILLQHATQICKSLAPAKKFIKTQQVLQLGFTIDGRTCPTATRLEGLFSALNFLPTQEFSSLRTNIHECVEVGIQFLIRSQIISGKYRGAIPRAVAFMPANNPNSQSFNERATEIRIDYVQHALSAFLQYRETLTRTKSK